jgi:hypothetical protein
MFRRSEVVVREKAEPWNRTNVRERTWSVVFDSRGTRVARADLRCTCVGGLPEDIREVVYTVLNVLISEGQLNLQTRIMTMWILEA